MDATISHNHEIYNQFSHSFQNIIVSNLMKVLNSYGICNGISVPVAAISFIEHSVPKSFTFYFIPYRGYQVSMIPI